jgi:hypothetical protein
MLRRAYGSLLCFLLLYVIAAVLGLAYVGGDSHCTADGLQWVGCILDAHEGLAAGLIGAAGVIFAGWLAWVGVRDQIAVTQEQGDEDRRRFQQQRHQAKYAMALALCLEAERIGLAATARIPLAELSRSNGKHPRRDQMLISIFPLIRGEREDIGLLGDDLQDRGFELVRVVDHYNSHIEALPRTANDPVVSVDATASELLDQIRDRSKAATEALNLFLQKVRSWRCQRCNAFIDEILDVIEHGKRKRCPICGDATRIAQAALHAQAQIRVMFDSNVIRASEVSGKDQGLDEGND